MRYSLPFILLLLMSCGQDAKHCDALNTAQELALINGLMAEQEAAWNNADIPGFMGHYWKSDSLVFVGKRGLTRGWQQTFDNYKRSYPDASAMGQLHFTNLQSEVMDDANAMVIGRWELFRTADTLSGHYMLFWKKIGGRWCIVADHSS